MYLDTTVSIAITFSDFVFVRCTFIYKSIHEVWVQICVKYQAWINGELYTKEWKHEYIGIKIAILQQVHVQSYEQHSLACIPLVHVEIRVSSLISTTLLSRSLGKREEFRRPNLEIPNLAGKKTLLVGVVWSGSGKSGNPLTLVNN